MSVGIFCFLGFVYALHTLNGSIGLPQICRWLLEVYFGLDATGFEEAGESVSQMVIDGQASSIATSAQHS